MSELLDAAENSGIERAVEETLKLRASMLLREAARACELFPWTPGALKRWMYRDEFESVLQTNQGNFRIVIRKE